MKIAGVVVLYNPDDAVVSNINRYINDLDILYVVDNSDKKNIDVLNRLKEIKKVLYKDNHGNKGIAHALNRGASLALKQGYKWLLTMDQDSQVDKDMLPVMKKFISDNDVNCIGIIAPKIIDQGKNIKMSQEQITYKMTVITSGSLMNLEIYETIGRFVDKLFIQYVDYEYCLRLLKYEYKIIEIGSAILYQKYGEPLKKDSITLYNYQPIRHYYRIRNGLFLCSKFEKIFPYWIKQFRIDLKSRIYHDIIFEKCKLRRTLFIIRGIIDYKLGRYGKIKG